MVAARWDRKTGGWAGKKRLDREEEGDSQREVFGRSKRGAKEELISFGLGMISTLFCVFSVQKVLSPFFLYI